MLLLSRDKNSPVVMIVGSLRDVVWYFDGDWDLVIDRVDMLDNRNGLVDGDAGKELVESQQIESMMSMVSMMQQVIMMMKTQILVD